MKKNGMLISVIALLLTVLTVFSGCDGSTEPVGTTAGGEGGSDISIENTSETTASQPKYSMQDKLIALTFDDGPRKKTTNEILDILEENGGAATFFVVGYNIEKNVETIKRAVEMGCEIGNHSNDHLDLTKCTADELRKQVDRPNELVKSLTGVDVKLFRTPGGAFQNIEKDIGMPIMQWSIDTEDWKFKDAANKDRTAEEREADLNAIANEVVEKAAGGDIILMHDIYDFTADLCELIVPALVEKGFKLVTVSEMYEAYGEKLEDGKVYYNIDLAVKAGSKLVLEAGSYQVKTKGGVLNLRGEPTYEVASIAKVPNGTPLTVIKSVQGWAYVEYNGVQGWVNAGYLVKTQ